MFGSSLFVAPAPSHGDGEINGLGGMTSAEIGSALNARSFAEPWNAARNGVVSIFDMDNPRLETRDFTLPLQERWNNVFFSHLTPPAQTVHQIWPCKLQPTPLCGIDGTQRSSTLEPSKGAL